MARSAHVQRGQTIPVWIFGIMTSLMLMLLVFNYANSVRWQIRAQNAADSVAQGIISVQANHYNQTLATLHTAAIEEYRIRRTMNALLEILQGGGGCSTGNAPTRTGWIDCGQAYISLRNNYINEVNRYTQDVQKIQAISQYTQTEQLADMQTIANSFQNNCTSSGPAGGDCVFKYTIAQPTQRPSLSGALADAGGEDNGNGRALPNGGNIVSDLNPLQIEVDACAVVTPAFTSVFNLGGGALVSLSKPFTALGRAAATTTMVTQEWFNPGLLNNPNSPSGGPFNGPEFVETSNNAAPSFYNPGTFCNSNGSGYDWYAVHWCSNQWISIFNNPGSSGTPSFGGYTATITSDEYSVWTGWWSAVPVPPYTGTFTPSSANCAQNVNFAS